MNNAQPTLATEIRNEFRSFTTSNADAIAAGIITVPDTQEQAPTLARIEGVSITEITRQITEKQMLVGLPLAELFFEFQESFELQGVTNPRKQNEEANLIAQVIKSDLQKEIATLREVKSKLTRQIEQDKRECGAAVREQVVVSALNTLFAELGEIMHDYLPKTAEITLANGEMRTVNVADFMQETQRIAIEVQADGTLKATVGISRIGNATSAKSSTQRSTTEQEYNDSTLVAIPENYNGGIQIGTQYRSGMEMYRILVQENAIPASTKNSFSAQEHLARFGFLTQRYANKKAA